jgi:hypothetical protein
MRLGTPSAVIVTGERLRRSEAGVRHARYASGGLLNRLGEEFGAPCRRLAAARSASRAAMEPA